MTRFHPFDVVEFLCRDACLIIIHCPNFGGVGILHSMLGLSGQFVSEIQKHSFNLTRAYVLCRYLYKPLGGQTNRLLSGNEGILMVISF
jgi:hypothetical protein